MKEKVGPWVKVLKESDMVRWGLTKHKTGEKGMTGAEPDQPELTKGAEVKSSLIFWVFCARK